MDAKKQENINELARIVAKLSPYYIGKLTGIAEGLIEAKSLKEVQRQPTGS